MMPAAKPNAGAKAIDFDIADAAGMSKPLAKQAEI
jgi:hypothetical protein